jgi:hypothetical protein
MSNEQNSRRALIHVAMLSLVVAGCAHNTSESAQLHDGLAPFSSTRTQAIGLVATTKPSLAAADLNTLATAYTSLEEKANAYAGFMIEAVTTSSFDQTRNAKYAGDFAKAISAFDKTFAGVKATHQTAIADAWVPSFAQTLATRWNQYSGVIAKMSPQTKADLITQLKRETVWPTYEDIATEQVVGTRQ